MEFALVVPVFLVLLVGMLDFGKAINYWIDETHLANEAARFAAVDKDPPGGQTLQDWIREQADTEELRDGGTQSVANPLAVCVSFPEGQEVGDPVTVEVKATYDWMPFLNLDATEAQLHGSATMRIEKVPANTSETDNHAGCA